MQTAATGGTVRSAGSGRIAFDASAATLPGVSAPSSVVRSIIRTARSSAKSFDSRLMERRESESARSSTATWSTEPMRGSRGSSGSSKPRGSTGVCATKLSLAPGELTDVGAEKAALNAGDVGAEIDLLPTEAVLEVRDRTLARLEGVLAEEDVGLEAGLLLLELGLAHVEVERALPELLLECVETVVAPLEPFGRDERLGGLPRRFALRRGGGALRERGQARADDRHVDVRTRGAAPARLGRSAPWLGLLLGHGR